jgi:O-methyltransferase
MPKSWRLRAKELIPPTLLNNTLLRMPFLYRTALVNYETNMGPSELEDLHEIIPEVIQVPGDLIECGASRCGSAIITALWLRKHGISRRIYACDSFEGFMPAEFERQRQLGMVQAGSRNAFTSTNYEYVLRKLKVLGLDRTIVPVKGYFQDTLKGIPGPFCYALIDCDLEDSVEYCGRALFPKLSPGGWMVFDDYFSQDYKGARHAVDRFVQDHRPQIEFDEPRRDLYVVRKRHAANLA